MVNAERIPRGGSEVGPSALRNFAQGDARGGRASFSSGRKRLFWWLAQRQAVATASLLHATSESEIADVRAAGLAHPTVLAPNGVDTAFFDGALSGQSERQRTVLSLGRIHPKKGLDRLIRAFAKIEAHHPGWRLRIVGPSERGHAEELRRMAGNLGCERVLIEGPVYGVNKVTAYRSADIFALPTLHENFAMTVAESLAAGTPVVSTMGAPWSGLERRDVGCGLNTARRRWRRPWQSSWRLTKKRFPRWEQEVEPG